MYHLRKAIIVSCAAATISAACAAQKPNVVFIFADDMGPGDISALNSQSLIETPHLDSMVRNGMHFTDAHTSSSVCTPSRYGVITGRYAWRTKLKSSVLVGFSPHMIDPDRMTVADVFKKAGYSTACIGKWHMGMDLPSTDGKVVDAVGKDRWSIIPKNIDWKGQIKNGPNENGFDYYYGITGSLDMSPFVYVENDRFTAVPTTTKKFKRKGPATEDFEAVDVMDTLTSKTVEYIEKQPADKPFFIYMPLTAPHTPVVPSKNFKGKSKVHLYGDFCMEVDNTVGRVVNALKTRNILENTIVIFSADNGCSKAALKFAGKVLDLTPQTASSKKHHSSYIYRGSKADLWEGGHRVPFLVQWPGQIKPNTKSDEVICLTDIMATMGELLEVPIPANAAEDSLSFFPALSGDKIDKSKREAIVNHSMVGRFAIRKGKWKLAFCPGSGGWTAPKDKAALKMGLPEIQLYDMEKDPSESNNLQADFPEIVSSMKKLLIGYIENGRSTVGAVQKNDAPWESGLEWMK